MKRLVIVAALLAAVAALMPQTLEGRRVKKAVRPPFDTQRHTMLTNNSRMLTPEGIAMVGYDDFAGCVVRGDSLFLTLTPEAVMRLDADSLKAYRQAE